MLDLQMLNIISEETAPFFAGDKGIDEVCDIIQSRALTYVKEHQ